MTNAPERIWACMGGPMVGLFVSGGNNGGWPEYVSADIVQSLTAERDRLRAALEQFLIEYDVVDLANTEPLSLTAAVLEARAALKGERHD